MSVLLAVLLICSVCFPSLSQKCKFSVVSVYWCGVTLVGWALGDYNNFLEEVREKYLLKFVVVRALYNVQISCIMVS